MHQNLRDKLKEVEEENKKMHDVYLVKLRELENLQSTLQEEFKQVKKDIDTYSVLFKMESSQRSKVIKEKDDI